MTDALFVGATGMRAHQTQVDTIANNIANVNTVGFRRETVNFSSVMAALQSGATDPLGQSLRADLESRGAWLADVCTNRGWRFSTRLHILLWGDRRGV